MPRRKVRKSSGSLLRFVTRAVSDRTKSLFGVRMRKARPIAKAAMRAVVRGKRKGLR